MPRILNVALPRCAAPGERIRIRGENLGDAGRGWTFRLGGTPLDPEAWSETEVELRVPEPWRDRSAPPAERMPIELRSRWGALLAQAEQDLSPCPDAPPSVGPDSIPTTRGMSAGAQSRLVRSPVGGELLIFARDSETLRRVEVDARALGTERPGEIVELNRLGSTMLHLHFPDAGAAGFAAQRLREQHPGVRIVSNKLYRPESPRVDRVRHYSGARRASRVPVPRCGEKVPIGVIDTGFDLGHPELAGARISLVELGGDRPRSDRLLRHGTAVASRLIGRSLGPLPYASLYAVSAFWESEDEIVSSSAEILRALDWLLGSGVKVINLSLTGEDDPEVARALALAHDQGVALVAAAGSGGRASSLAFPASMPQVVSVTAVDSRLEPHRLAPNGADFAAFGVDVRVAETYPQRTEGIATGTSFAVPAVTAAMSLDPSGFSGLVNVAEDVGEPGSDPVYGWGLIRGESLCSSGHHTKKPSAG